ncbi:MAG TPA: TetR/AcrR family transcriptional regulator [Propionibacteriaceae bacterium]|nr:TetR/AcrR family transcriptional regulator [Propionibacteriaceae bacterium]
MPRSEAVPDVAAATPRTDHRTRPRRRGHALDMAILNATIAEIDLSGYAGLSMERVAERARASKASLYRRWPSKVELVMAAIYDLLPDPASAADTGSLRGDLLALFRSSAEMLAGPAGTAIRGLMSDALREPELAAQLRRYTRGRSVAAMQEVVRRALERGELLPGPITARQLEAGLSVMRFHFLTHGPPVPDQVIVEIVDEVVLPLLHAAAGRHAP